MMTFEIVLIQSFPKKLISTIEINQKALMDIKVDQYYNVEHLFDKIYVIALPARKQYILKSLQSYHIQNIEIIDPILKENLNHKELIKENIISTFYSYDNIGTIACHLSHLKSLEMFLADENAQTALIFEDDIMECDDVEFYYKRMYSLQKELKELNLEWDLLYLGHCWSNCAHIKFVTTQLCTGGSPLCNHAYVVTRKGAQKIIEYGIPMKEHSDIIRRTMIEKEILKSILVMPPIFLQSRESLGSTIGNENELRLCNEIHYHL